MAIDNSQDITTLLGQASIEAAAPIAEASHGAAPRAGAVVRQEGPAFTGALGQGGLVTTQPKFIPDASEQFEEGRRKLADAVPNRSVDKAILMALPDPAEDGVKDLRQSLAGLVEGVVRTNLRTSQEMLRVTTHSELVALQQRFIREYMSALTHGSIQLVSIIQQIAGQALPRLEQPVEKRLQGREVVAD